MALENNNPNKGYIYISGLVITYNNKACAINNKYTNDKYIYWNKTDPNNLLTTNTRKINKDLYFIIKNINGNGFILPNKDITLTFDSFDNHNIIQKINNIKQDSKVYSKQLELISNNVENLSDEYKSTKTFDEIKEELNTSIINSSSLLTSLKTLLNTYLNDEKFTKNEKIDVGYKLEDIQNKFIQTLASADALIDLKLKETSVDVSVTTQYQTLLEVLLSQIIEQINVIIESETEDVKTSDIIPITSNIDSIINTLSNLKNSCNELKFLGAGATISDEVYNANLRIDDILQDISELQSSLVNSLNKEKQRIEQYFDENQKYSNKIVVLTNEIRNNGNSLTNSQYGTLKQYTTIMKNSLTSIKSTYETYYNNENIDESNKKLLKTNYDNFENKHKIFTDIIDVDLADLDFSKSERSEFNISLADYRSARSSLKAQLSYCVSLVDNATIETNLEQIKEDLSKEILEVKNNYRELEKRVDDIDTRLKALETNNITEG